MNRRVVIDASIALKLVVSEPKSTLARDLLRAFALDGVELYAPPLILSELAEGLFYLVRANLLTVERSAGLFRAVINQMTISSPDELYERAMVIAVDLQIEHTYGMQYVALAQILQADLWTADTILFKLTAHRYGFIHQLGETTRPVLR